MIPFRWKVQRDRAARRSPSAGDNDRLLIDLFDIAAAYHQESVMLPDWAGIERYLSAWQIQTVIIKYLRGELSESDAAVWVEAGTVHLAELARCRRTERGW